MKRIQLILFLFLGFTLSSFSNSHALNKEEATHILKEFIRTEFKILEVREAPLEGFWEVAAEVGQEKLVVYIHKNLRYVFHGQLLDRQIKRNLTVERLKEFRSVDLSKLLLENAVPMGKGKRKLYVFTDPECQMCLQLHEELKRMQDIQAFLFLYPLTPHSYEKAKRIWCSPNRLLALEEVYQGMEIKSPGCGVTAIDRNIELGKRLLIDSTPTLIFQNGKMVEGYVSSDKLENLINLNK